MNFLNFSQQGAVDVAEAITLLIISGIIMRFSLTLTGQTWAKTYQQTMGFIILPVITYVITKTITGNIALSLGMIGAMSIVISAKYIINSSGLFTGFLNLTIGIAASVRTKWAILLVLVIIGSIFSIKLIQIIYKKFNKSFYTTSFNEGVDLNIIEISASSKIEILENNENLRNVIIQKESNEIFYRLGFENINDLKKLKNTIETNNNINKIDITYA